MSSMLSGLLQCVDDAVCRADQVRRELAVEARCTHVAHGVLRMPALFGMRTAITSTSCHAAMSSSTVAGGFVAPQTRVGRPAPTVSLRRKRRPLRDEGLGFENNVDRVLRRRIRPQALAGLVQGLRDMPALERGVQEALRMLDAAGRQRVTQPAFPRPAGWPNR